MNLVKGHRDASWAEIQRAQLGVSDKREHFTMYGVWIHHAPRDTYIDWFGKMPLQYGDKLLLPQQEGVDGMVLPLEHNLAVDTGLHISAQRTFVTVANATLTPVASTTNNGVRYGGVDNNVAAVANTTTQFDTTAGNRFIKVFDADPTYSTANKRMTGLFTIANTDTTIVQRRYGIGNDVANAANTLFSMLSGFILDFNGKAFSITVESQSNWTGS